jgi:hypothetical protein
MHRFSMAARCAVALSLVLLPSRIASAQNVGAGAGRPFHAVVLSTGMTMMAVDPLNARMTSSQFATLSNDAVSYGGAGYLAVGRALLGAEVQRSTFGEEGLNNGRTGDLSAMQGLATVAYALLSTDHLSIFPQLGVGMGRVVVTLRDRSGAGTTVTQPTFDEIAQTPGSESRVTGRHLLYSFGGGADYLVTPRGAGTGVVLGVRAGLTASPNRATWTRDGQAVLAGPDAGAGGPYLRVVVGLGGRGR